MNISKKITSLFSVMEDEVISFRLLFLQSFFIGFANSYYYIVSSSLLIKNISINHYPYAYIITGIGGFILIKLYKAIQKKYGISGSFKISILVFSIICFANFFTVYAFGANKAVTPFLTYFIVLFAVPFTTIFSLCVFAQCSRLYNISQSKRLLALIVSGEIIASVLAYMSVPFLRALIKGNTFVLLPVSGIVILLVLIPYNKLFSLYKDKIDRPFAKKATVKINLAFFTKDKFYTLIAFTTVFSVFAIYIVDYAYLISVRYMSAPEQTGIEIAEIVSVFFFVVKIAELTFSFLSGKILSNKGIRFSILLLPVFLLFSFSLAFITGYLFNGIPVFLLSFLFLAKLTERAVRKSITTPSQKVLYQVADPHDRQEIEASIDGLLNQVATVLSGILLLIISTFFFGKNQFVLLRLFSFVGVVAFALWSFFSMRMYDSYRVKMKNFLSGLKSEAVPDAAAAPSSAVSSAQGYNPAIAGGIKDVIHKVENADGEDLLGLIKIYNPRQSVSTAADSPEKVIEKLIRIYYNNNFYFSRLLIIRYLSFCSDNNAFKFLQELWEVSDTVSKLELMISFNKKTSANIDPVFFERLCEECANDIMWTESCLNDTDPLKNEPLIAELKSQKASLIHLLFELLKAIYEPSVIQVIHDIITKENAELENQFFALELLEITLRPGLKEIIKHLLEPVSFDNKKQALEKTFHIYHLSPKDRLVDILMKDYNLVSPQLKEVALVAYSETSDEQNVLSAFRSSSIDNLRYKSNEIFSGSKDAAYIAKLDILNQLESSYNSMSQYAPYLLNHALAISNQHKAAINKYFTKSSIPAAYSYEIRSSSNQPVMLDALAFAVLATLKQ